MSDTGLPKYVRDAAANPIGAMSQIDLVEVKLEDLILAEAGFDFECQEQFVKLACTRFFTEVKVKVARHLHGDGAGALGFGHRQHVRFRPARTTPTQSMPPC